VNRKNSNAKTELSKLIYNAINWPMASPAIFDHEKLDALQIG